jgi:hypothetical protein
MESLERARIECWDSPARPATSSRERPTRTRAAWRCEPVNRTNVIAKLCARRRWRTLPLDPSQAVNQGREIEARSASSCCERPARLRAARSIPPVISTIVMLRLFARRQRASMSAYFTNSLTPPSGLGLLASPRGGPIPGRAARGSVAPRKMACQSPAGRVALAVQGHRLALERGSLVAAPF